MKSQFPATLCVVLGNSFNYAELAFPSEKKPEDETKLALMYVPIPAFSKHPRNNSIFKTTYICSMEVKENVNYSNLSIMRSKAQKV